MAEYQSVCRSNYVPYKDTVAFQRLCQLAEVMIDSKPDPKNPDRQLFMFYSEQGLPSTVTPNEEDPDSEIDFLDELQPLIEDGYVLVIQTCGHCKCAEVYGWATAMTNTGDPKSVDLNDIYALANTLPRDTSIDITWADN